VTIHDDICSGTTRFPAGELDFAPAARDTRAMSRTIHLTETKMRARDSFTYRGFHCQRTELTTEGAIQVFGVRRPKIKRLWHIERVYSRAFAHASKPAARLPLLTSARACRDWVDGLETEEV
jgi:hypothetical protein